MRRGVGLEHAHVCVHDAFPIAFTNVMAERKPAAP